MARWIEMVAGVVESHRLKPVPLGQRNYGNERIEKTVVGDLHGRRLRDSYGRCEYRVRAGVAQG